MIARLVTQPFEDGANLYDFLDERLRSPQTETFLAVTAWAKRSGLRRATGPLQAFADHGGRSRIIVGIDEGGATRQGLELALELFDEVFVFHDPSHRTFHPKMYLAREATSARLFVGSNNLTAGGVFFNYEAALEIELDLDVPADANVLDALDRYVDRLLGETELCLQLSEELLRSLIANPRYRIGNEDERQRAAARPEETTDVPEDTDQIASPEPPDGEIEPVFGRAQAARRRDPAPVVTERGPTPMPVVSGEGEEVVTSEVQTPQPAAEAEATPAVGVSRRWTKRLARSDAQQPSPGSNPTGNLRLTQAGHQINWRTFFRSELFSTANWIPQTDSQGNPIEVAEVEFEVVVRGVPMGLRRLTVDHGPHREAGQANHVTVLHWDDMVPILQATSYVDDFVVIEQMVDGTYRLEIRPDPPEAVT